MATHGPVVCPPSRVFGSCLPSLTVDLVSEFTLVPLETAMIRYLGLHSSAELRGISCVRRWTHTHTHAHIHVQSLALTTWAGLRAQGWWWWWWWVGGGGLGADTFLLTITSHTGTHIPTSWWTHLPSTTTTTLFHWATSQSSSSPNRSWWNCASSGQTYVVEYSEFREAQNYSWICLQKRKFTPISKKLSVKILN